jgi:hypothetical protein
LQRIRYSGCANRCEDSGESTALLSQTPSSNVKVENRVTSTRRSVADFESQRVSNVAGTLPATLEAAPQRIFRNGASQGSEQERCR